MLAPLKNSILRENEDAERGEGKSEASEGKKSVGELLHILNYSRRTSDALERFLFNEFTQHVGVRRIPSNLSTDHAWAHCYTVGHFPRRAEFQGGEREATQRRGI